MRIVAAILLLIITASSGAPLHRLSTADVPGVTSPLPIDPLVDIPDDRFLLDL
jgi:hypothetical protein